MQRDVDVAYSTVVLDVRYSPVYGVMLSAYTIYSAQRNPNYTLLYCI